ncbi:hypothetical protein [uncultured Microbacterium sp.]|uniref:hypothetical protein n=1 Tax=uncultured Microbacterium sp. TaxID=191216 RepID=UPI0025D102CE|nr:hypothetical protein [uncultured Microbacterium sp.]
MVESATPISALEEYFHESIEPLLFARAQSVTHPSLTLLASPLAIGRSRALSRFSDESVVLNAADLRMLAPVEGDAAEAAASLLQLSLAHARHHRFSVALDGRFRTPGVAVGLARLFASSGFSTRFVAIAEREAEVKLSAASSRLLEWRRGAGDATGGRTGPVTVLPVLSGVAENPSAVQQVVVLSRTGDVAFRSANADHAGAVSAFEAAAAERLGTLRSTLWLSQLRHMTRFLGSQRSAPRWAVDDLIDLHEFALTEIVPELPIPADSEFNRIQVARLSATLSVLRDAPGTDAHEDVALSLPVPAPTAASRSL